MGKKTRIDITTPPPKVSADRTLVEAIYLLGLGDDTEPNSAMVIIRTGRLDTDGNFIEMVGDKVGPIDGFELYDRDPEAFDRVHAAVAAQLIADGLVPGTVVEE